MVDGGWQTAISTLERAAGHSVGLQSLDHIAGLGQYKSSPAMLDLEAAGMSTCMR